MNKTMIKIASIGLATFLFTGCATVMNDKTQPISFNTIPEGATVKVNDKIIGKTPMAFNLERDNASTVKFEKEGFESVEQPLETEISGVFWGNILIGGVLGSTTDASTKKMYEYAPNQYTIELKKLETEEKKKEEI